MGARVVVYAAEINTVLSRRLWPRSLFTPPVLEADRRVLTDMAKAQARIDEEHIDVRFDEPDQPT